MPPIEVISISQNQKPIRELLSSAGWEIRFRSGKPIGDRPDGSAELNIGEVTSPIKTRIIQLRSEDMAKKFADGSLQVAILGRDVLDEFRPNGVQITEYGKVPVGRKWGVPQPRLELVANRNSRVKKPEEIPAGSIILTERPRLTAAYLTEVLADTNIDVVEENPKDNPSEFRRRLGASGSVGLRKMLGSGPAWMVGEDIDSTFVVMVNEEGTTVRDYDLKVLGKLMDIDTVLIAREDMLTPREREHLVHLGMSMESEARNLQRLVEAAIPLEQPTPTPGERRL